MNQGSFIDKIGMIHQGIHCSRQFFSADTRQKTQPAKINGSEEEHSFSLKEGQAIVFDNKNTVHARRGIVGNRLLLRAWVEKRLMGK